MIDPLYALSGLAVGAIVGLTGGIGSGKSAVAAEFARHGVPVIDTDLLAREVVEPGQPALAAVVAEFGPGILGHDGRLDQHPHLGMEPHRLHGHGLPEGRVERL